MNKYLIGGITIATEINFPELVESKNEIDTSLAYGSIPEIKGDLEVERVFMKIYNSNEVIFTIPDLANFYIKGSEEIIVELLDDERKSDAEKYVLSLAFGIISYKKGYYPLHGGGIIHKGKAILITGPSGTGKSTTMVGLSKRGFKTFGDDISNLFFKDGSLYVHPSFPRFKLWDESMKMLNTFDSGEYKMRQDVEKYLLPMNSFVSEPVEVDRVYLLREHRSESDFRFKEFTGMDKVIKLKNNSYKPFMEESFGLKQKHFTMLMQFSKDLKFYEFHRKKKKDQFDEMLDTLINHFDQ